MEKNGDEQSAPNDPKEHPELAQLFGVTVDPFRAEENLEVAEEMTDDEEDQDEPRDRHNHFPADR